MQQSELVKHAAGTAGAVAGFAVAARVLSPSSRGGAAFCSCFYSLLAASAAVEMTAGTGHGPGVVRATQTWQSGCLAVGRSSGGCPAVGCAVPVVCRGRAAALR